MTTEPIRLERKRGRMKQIFNYLLGTVSLVAMGVATWLVTKTVTLGESGLLALVIFLCAFSTMYLFLYEEEAVETKKNSAEAETHNE